MTASRKLHVAALFAGILSLAALIFERLALMDIFQGEPDLRLEWTVVHVAVVPLLLFHLLGIGAALSSVFRRNK